MMHSHPLFEFINSSKIDGINWKADWLLGGCEADERQEILSELAKTIALLPDYDVRSNYIRDIAERHGLDQSIFTQLVSKSIRSNKPIKNEAVADDVAGASSDGAETNLLTRPFFNEIVGSDSNNIPILKGIEINYEKFISLLAGLGFARYEISPSTNGDENVTLVYLDGPFAQKVTRQEIIDHVIEFIKTRYDFSNSAFQQKEKLKEKVLNKLYSSARSVFSKDILARVKPTIPLNFCSDTVNKTLFFFSNGFVEVTKSGPELKKYEEMNGHVWEQQVIKANVTIEDHASPLHEMRSDYADFCWKISGECPNRFESLCSLLGYATHNYVNYKLKAILLTDSSLSDKPEGRTGKTMAVQLLEPVRICSEINGKDFDPNDRHKYQTVDDTAHIVHLNDVRSTGRNKFCFEDVFNDVTEGFIVNKKFCNPFRKKCKMFISSNKTLDIQGASQRDRILEFEVSSFFNENLNPEMHYGRRLGRDWNQSEWNEYYNFMFYCSKVFHDKGIIAPPSINLEERKLREHTAIEFVEFMDDCISGIESTGNPFEGTSFSQAVNPGPVKIQDYRINKKGFYNEFIKQHDDMQLSGRKFSQWLIRFGELRFGIKRVHDFRSNGVGFIQFIERESGKQRKGGDGREGN